MSGDRLASSFGDPNAQPPTPKQTPTSAIFPSPVFETPKNSSRPHPYESTCGGWTPRFAEEYSVFNSTPGNLRGSQDEFGIPATPYNPPPSGHKRPISVDEIAAAAETASHVNPFSPRPDLSSLPPVEPHRRLPSSPNPLGPGFDQSVTGNEWAAAVTTPQDRTSKKVRRGTIVKPGEGGQTATPPPSTRKGERRLAPKVDPDAMQTDQGGGFGQPDFSDQGQHQQHNMGGFVTSPGDMFGYPLSATAPGFPDQRGFWAPDPSMAGMDIDFGAAGGDVFQDGNAGHGTMDSLDWNIQDPGMVAQQGQESAANSQGRRERPIVSKASMSLDTSSVDQSMFAGTYPTPIDDPFGIVGGSGGVDPGLLFSRPPSSSIDAAFDPSLPPSSSAPPAPQSAHPSQQVPGPVIVKARSVRRSNSVKELSTGRRTDRATLSSPTKSVGRPGLARSFSENRGKKPLGRASLPTLAPAPRTKGQSSSNSGGPNRPIVSQPIRPGGRSSPLKSHHHHRLSSLSSIPEALGPRARAQAKFTIDASGRARVETTVVVEDEGPQTIRNRHSAQPLGRHQRWNSSEDDDSSSEDDDPIVIPSRNNSFVLPDPRRPSNTHPFHSSQRSISDRSTASYGTLAGGGSQDGGDSEAETIMSESTPVPGGKSGDAASELRKLRQSRQKKTTLSPTKHGRSQPPRLSTAGFVGGGYPGQDTISPTTLTETSLPTPSTDSRGHGLRCVCHRQETERGGDEYMVQCESCEMWLHGRCVNVTKRTQPSVYICAFCANTPNMRGGRLRDNGRAFGAAGPPGAATSPLAHKSFKFR